MAVKFILPLEGTCCVDICLTGFPCHILFWGFGLVFYIEALSSYFILRLRPHILYWGFVLILFWGFGLVFYFEASSSYFIFRLCPHILFEASASYFVLSLCLHILFWGFVLIFCIEALSPYFSLRRCPPILYGSFILTVFFFYYLRLCSSVWGFGPPSCRPLLLCLYCLFGLFTVICVWFCLFLFLCRITRWQYHLVWVFIHILVHPLFWFTCSYINFNIWFCWLPCFDMCGHYRSVLIVMG